METGMVFRSATDAAEFLNVKYGNKISACCAGINATAYGYHWRYANETQEDWDSRRKVYTESHGISPIRKIYCIETGEIFQTAESAAKTVGIHSSGITNVCTGKQLTAGGFHWRYFDETEEEKNRREARSVSSSNVVQGQQSTKKVLCVETGVIYNSLTSASNTLGINRVGITNACHGKAKTAGGFHWKIVE